MLEIGRQARGIECPELTIAHMQLDLAVLHVDDLARACFHLLDEEDPPDWVNVGSGSEVSILDLATAIGRTVGFKGDILTDPSKPDGTPRKLMDVSRMKKTGWEPTVSLEEGLRITYDCFLAERAAGSVRTG